MVPSLTGAAWASLGRVTESRKRGEPEHSPEGAVRLLVALLLGEVVFDLDAPGGQGLDGVRNVAG